MRCGLGTTKTQCFSTFWETARIAKTRPHFFFAFRCGRPAKKCAAQFGDWDPFSENLQNPSETTTFERNVSKTQYFFHTFWTSLNAKTACPQPACAAQPLQNQENSWRSYLIPDPHVPWSKRVLYPKNSIRLLYYFDSILRVDSQMRLDWNSWMIN